MYSQGESFFYEINDDEVEFNVLANIEYEDKEYIIAENLEGDTFIFFYDDTEENIELVEFDVEASEIISYWKDEFDEDDSPVDLGDEDYYDREDRLDTSINDIYSDEEKGFF